MSRLIVKGNPKLQRDTKSNGILNNDDVAYQEYLIKKHKALLLAEEKQNTNKKINNLEEQIVEIKNSLNKILEILSYDKS
jgi:hypothetical protein